MTVPYLAPRVRGINASQGAPSVAGGTFTANGASVPAVVGGIVASVRRLVDGGALPFFRVKMVASFPFDAVHSTPVFGVETVLPDAPEYAKLVTDKITPAPADVRSSDEIDVALFGAADTRVDTAGSKISFHLNFDQ